MQHLLAIGPMIARVAAPSERIGLGLALEIGAGHIVQQEVVLQSEEFAEAVLQEHFQGLLVRQQRIQRPVETLFVDLVRGNAQQIGQGALGVEVFGDVQLTGRMAETAEHEDQRHQRPRNVFTARRDRAVEKLL